jgi:hypothetical protein
MTNIRSLGSGIDYRPSFRADLFANRALVGSGDGGGGFGGCGD